MKNVTITLDETTLARVRREAARQNLSLSRYVGELLRRHIKDARQYEQAMRRSLSGAPVLLSSTNEPYPKRDELYDRTRLR